MRNPAVAVFLLLAVPLCGFALRPLTAGEQAMLRHAVNNDPAWTTLADTEVYENKDKGLMFARFGPAVSKMNGAGFEISGFMTPLEASTRTRHFILTRRDTTCPFCPPNAPTEAIEVTLDHPIPFSRGQVRVEGRLQLISTSATSLFFRLAGAKATELSPGGQSS